MKKGIKIFIFLISIFLIISLLSIITYSKKGNINIKIAIRLQLDKIINSKTENNISMTEIREHINSEAIKWSKQPIPFSNIQNTYIDAFYSKIPVRIYTPTGNRPFPIIIYSHGGGWIAGSLDIFDSFCRKLSLKTNAIVISVDYRLAPENPFPSALNDVYNVLLWVNDNAKSINGDKNKIALAGDSSGGNIMAVISQISKDKSGPNIICQVLIYPATNIYELTTKSWSTFANNDFLSRKDMEKFISMYVPEKEDRKNPYASPLLAETFINLPKTLIILAEIDPLYDDGIEYGKKLKEAGIQIEIKKYTGVPHGFITMDKVSNKSNEAIEHISSYLKKEFSKTAASLQY